MTEQQADAIRQALEQAEQRALERGEPFTEEQARALVDRFLSRAERKETIRQLSAGGASRAEIASRGGLSPRQVSNVLRAA